MGPQQDYIETVVTCEGDYHDPQLQDRLRRFQQRLESLLLEDGKNQLVLKKVEPWNSVRVTFHIPREAAMRLKQLAEQGSASLRQMGVLGVQIEGDRLVSLTVATPNNQRAELIIRTHDGSGQAAAAAASAATQASSSGASFDPGLPSSSDELGSPGPSMEVTRKNIEEYLRQGFTSIVSSPSGAGPSGSGASTDIFKAPSADGGPLRANNIASEAMPGSSGQSGFLPRPSYPVLGGHGQGAFAPPVHSGGGPAPGHRGGPKASAAHHVAHPQPPQLQQQMPSQATALPQTAALGYNMVNLPPPPPYPHGHGAGVANNVGRQGKKMTASSPLLINLLQTEPVAGANNVMAAPGAEKPKKKRRRRKPKQAAATATSEGQLSTQGVHSLPSETNPGSSIVPPPTMPSAEEMSAVLHRQVSPVPLPSPRLSADFVNSVPANTEHGIGSEGFRDRKTSTASAALATLAQSQRSASENDQFNTDAIINPYTGHMEPRDSASDLSPVKKDLHKTRSDSLTDHPLSTPHSSLPVSSSAAKVDVRTGSGDSLPVGLGSLHSGAAVPSTLREERTGRVFPFSTSMSLPAQTHSVASDSVLGRRPDVPHPRATTTPSTPLSAAPHIYAQLPFGPSQPLSRMPHAAPPQQHSSQLPTATAPSANGPVSASSPPSTHSVSSGQMSVGQGSLNLAPGLERPGVNPYHMPPQTHRPQSSVCADVVHNVPVSSEVKVSGGGHVAGEAGVPQPRVVGSTHPVTHKADTRQGAPPPSTASAHVQSDSLKLLNSSSSSPTVVGAVQRVAVESATITTSTASPAGSKPPSDGDDNSNHSNVSPGGQADVTTAPSSLLDTNGTKVDNHDSGVGSSSERSEDTTPSEVGDGEFQASVATVEVSATDSNGSKVSVGVSKAVVNCKKEASGGGGDPHTITVGYVQMNQNVADIYNKDAKKHIADSAALIRDKTSAEDPLRQVSHLIKSTASLTSGADQVALTAHKDVEVSLSVSAKTSTPQQQRLVMKYRTAQVSGVHQNGPTSLPQGVRRQYPPGLRLPNNTHTTVHHPTGITISHSQGHLGVHHPPTSTPNTQAFHHPPVSTSTSQALHHPPVVAVTNSQGLHHQTPPVIVTSSQALHHPARSTTSVQGHIGLHHLPSTVPSSVSQGLFHHGAPAQHSASAGLHAVAPSSQSTGHGASNIVSATSHSGVHNTGVASFHSAVQNASTALSDSQGQKTTGTGHTSSAGQGNHPAGLVVNSSAVTSHSQGHVTAASVASSVVQHISVPQHNSWHPRPPSPGMHPHPHPSIGPSPANGPSLSSVLGHQAAQTHCQVSGERVAQSIPSPLVSAASAALNTTTSVSPISTVPLPHNDRGSSSQPMSSAAVSPVAGNLLPASISAEKTVKSQVTSTMGLTATGTADGSIMSGAVKQASPRLVPSNPSSLTVNLNKSGSHDLGSLASELVSSGVVHDLELLEAAYPHSEDSVFDDDLALVTEPGLSAFLDMGIRHGTTNGSGGVSAEARAGSNITSMYTKRSSPINVNMLNHMYAAGLPQPRRLTESVQRLVKPLPNQENSLPPGRTCKSPGASSSRHSSNGSTSPGRASQGGSRSPGVNTTSAVALSRNLSFDKMTSSPTSVVNSCSVGGAGGYTPSTHAMQPPLDGTTVNCISTSVIPVAPHPLTTLQTSASSRVKGRSSPAILSTGSVSLPSSLATSACGVSAMLTTSAIVSSSSSSISSLSSAVPALLTVTPQSVPDITVSSHQEGVTHDPVQPRLQLSTHNHSMSSSQISTSLPSYGPHPPAPFQPNMHHPPLPALVHLESSQENPCMSKVSSAVVPASASVPVVSSVSNHIQTNVKLSQPAVSSHPHWPLTSVCNTSTRVDSVLSSGSTHSSLTFSTPSSSISSPSPQFSTASAPTTISTTTLVRQQDLPLASSAITPEHINVAVCVASVVTTVVTTVPSSDLSVHTSVALMDPALALSSTANTVCVSSVSTVAISSPQTVISTLSVASECQQALTSTVWSSSVSTPKEAIVCPTTKCESTVLENSDAKTESGREPASQLHVKPSLAASYVDTAVSTSSVKPSLATSYVDTAVSTTSSNMSTPSSQSVASEVVHSTTEVSSTEVSSGNGDDHSRQLSCQGKPADSSVRKSGSGMESWSQAPVLKESTVKEKEEGGGTRVTASSMPPLSHHSVQDDSHTAQSENLHSKPPLLQPAPPLTLPTLLPSATPPPPPLTPVLLHDPARKEQVSNPGQSTPPLYTSAEGQVESATLFHLRDIPRTASPLALVPEPSPADHANPSVIRVDSKNSDTSSDAKHEVGSSKDTFSNLSITSSTSIQAKPTSQPTSSNSSIEDENLQARRFTRKRKNTHSESDSSSELAPKLLCLDSELGSENKETESKVDIVSDHPPKLQREGKRSTSLGDQKEEGEDLQKAEEKAVKMKEESDGNKEEENESNKDVIGVDQKVEEDKGGKKEEEKTGSKSAGHHDKNILEATPEEIAKKMAAATTGGKRRVHYTYVPEKSLNQSYFDTTVLTGRTRSQGPKKGSREGSVTAPGTQSAAATTPAAGAQATPQAASTTKEDAADASATPGSKRSTRSLRTKDASESSQGKRKRSKEHR